MLKLTNIQKTIFERRSVRGYLKKNVPKQIIKNIFKIAQKEIHLTQIYSHGMFMLPLEKPRKELRNN